MAPLAAQAEWYAGPTIFGGASDNDDFSRTPSTPFPFSGGAGDNGVSGGIGAIGGYDFTQRGVPVSLELSGSYRFRHDMNIRYRSPDNLVLYGAKSNVEAAELIVSALYDLPLGTTSWQPFIGGGAGVARVSVDTDTTGLLLSGSSDQSETNFAWQAQAGVKVPLDDTLNLRAEYRYIDYGDISTGLLPTGDRFDAKFFSHDVRLGLIWDF